MLNVLIRVFGMPSEFTEAELIRIKDELEAVCQLGTGLKNARGLEIFFVNDALQKKECSDHVCVIAEYLESEHTKDIIASRLATNLKNVLQRHVTAKGVTCIVYPIHPRAFSTSWTAPEEKQLSTAHNG